MNAIESRATQWLVRQDAGPLSPTEQQALDAWLTVDPRHSGAYIQVQANWLDLDRWAAHRRTSIPSRPATPKPLYLRWAVAASVVALAITAGVTAWRTLQHTGEVFTSSIGEVRKIALPDGSHLTLNTDTIANVNFEGPQREISLQRGEASFTVARDPRRPFIVHAKDVQIKALGTAFTVRIAADKTDVLVTEGVVEVSRPGSVVQPQRVTMRQLASLTVAEPRLDIEPVKPEIVERKLAWQEGKASFAGEPLSTAVAEINRHSRLQLYVDDPSLARAHVVGVFNADDSQTFANAVAAAFGAEITHAPDGLHLHIAAPENR